MLAAAKLRTDREPSAGVQGAKCAIGRMARRQTRHRRACKPKAPSACVQGAKCAVGARARRQTRHRCAQGAKRAIGSRKAPNAPSARARRQTRHRLAQGAKRAIGSRARRQRRHRRACKAPNAPSARVQGAKGPSARVQGAKGAIGARARRQRRHRPACKAPKAPSAGSPAVAEREARRAQLPRESGTLSPEIICEGRNARQNFGCNSFMSSPSSLPPLLAGFSLPGFSFSAVSPLAFGDEEEW